MRLSAPAVAREGEDSGLSVRSLRPLRLSRSDQWDRAEDVGSASGLRVDRDLTADGLDAVVRVAQASSVMRRARKPGSVVAHLEAQARACLVELDPNRGAGPCVLDRILHCFEAGEIDGALDLDRMPRDADGDKVDGHRGLHGDGAQ